MPDKKTRILFFGDVNGKIARLALKKILPGLKKKTKADLIIANADNIAHGKGLTADTLKELREAGVDAFTSGDHAFDRPKTAAEVYESSLPVVRPLNFSPQASGQGSLAVACGNGSVLLICLIGRVFMKMDHECPFYAVDRLLNGCETSGYKAIIVDMHAEATSEKIAMRHYLDGRVTAVIGTHTHVMTNDWEVSPRGTAYITDAGMVGANDGVLGVAKENIIKTFLTQIKHSHEIPESGECLLNGVLIEVAENQKASRIEAIVKKIKVI